VFQQDSLNLPHVQTGLKAQEQQAVIFASYNETKIRHFYENLFRFMGIDDPFATVQALTRACSATISNGTITS
jgi:hypothetical protein